MNWLWEAFSKNPFGAFSFLIGFAALVIFQWWRQRKSLRYYVQSQEIIVGVNEDYGENIKVYFEDREVKRVHLIVMEIANNGWRAIEPNDFVEPLTISFGQGAEVMTCQAVDCKPIGLKAETVTEGNTITIKPLLLNRKDTIRVKILINRFQELINVMGRIKDVPEIKEYDGQASTNWIMALIAPILFIILDLAFFGLIFYPYSNPIMPLHRVEVSVVNPDSKPIDNARVSIETSTSITSTKTDHSGLVKATITDRWSNRYTPIHLRAELDEYQTVDIWVSPYQNLFGYFKNYYWSASYELKLQRKTIESNSQSTN